MSFVSVYLWEKRSLYGLPCWSAIPYPLLLMLFPMTVTEQSSSVSAAYSTTVTSHRKAQFPFFACKYSMNTTQSELNYISRQDQAQANKQTLSLSLISGGISLHPSLSADLQHLSTFLTLFPPSSTSSTSNLTKISSNFYRNTQDNIANSKCRQGLHNR